MGDVIPVKIAGQTYSFVILDEAQLAAPGHVMVTGAKAHAAVKLKPDVAAGMVKLPSGLIAPPKPDKWEKLKAENESISKPLNPLPIEDTVFETKYEWLDVELLKPKPMQGLVAYLAKNIDQPTYQPKVWESGFLDDMISTITKQLAKDSEAALAAQLFYGPGSFVSFLDDAPLTAAANYGGWFAKKTADQENGRQVMAGILDLFPQLTAARARCPKVTSPWCHRHRTVTDVVVHLNDEHDWTREDIADWLDTLEVDLTIKEKNEDDPDQAPRYDEPSEQPGGALSFAAFKAAYLGA